MIVVDTSVWIDHIRGADTDPVERLRQAVRRDAVIVGDLVLLEILQGARDDAHAGRLERELRSFPIVPMMSEPIAVEASRLYRALRAEAITVRKTIDLVIATFCLMNDHELLQDDRDFLPMSDRFGLRLA